MYNGEPFEIRICKFKRMVGSSLSVTVTGDNLKDLRITVMELYAPNGTLTNPLMFVELTDVPC